MNINYEKSFEGCLAAQGEGTNFLLLQKLDSPIKRFDGKRVSYAIEHRWLSQECETEKDQSWACAQGQDVTYWSLKELKAIEVLDSKGAFKGGSIFDHLVLM